MAGWHLWLVLRHDLAALRQCLQRRVRSIGVWESVRGDGLLEAAIDGGVKGLRVGIPAEYAVDGMNPERTCEGSGIPDWKTTTAIATTMNQTITVRITS